MNRTDLSYLTQDQSMVGMPSNLATAATANLAREDASIARVNQAGRNTVTSALPTDVAPMSTTTAPAAQPTPGLDPYVADRHTALQNALATNTDPDKPAMYVDSKRRQELQGEFYKTTELVHQNALEEAHSAHENLIRQKDIAAANATTRLAQSIAGIKHEPGTPEHETALAGAILDNIGALDSASGAKLANLFTAEHDKAAVRRQAAEALRARVTGQAAAQDAKLPVNQPASAYATVDALKKDFGDVPYVQTADGYQPKPAAVEPATVVSEKKKQAVSKELNSVHKLSADEFLAGTVQYGNIEGEGKNRKFVPDADGKTGGKIAQVDVGGEKPATMTAAEYARYKNALGGTSEITRVTKDGKQAIFDSQTKKFIRYAQ